MHISNLKLDKNLKFSLKPLYTTWLLFILKKEASHLNYFIEHYGFHLYLRINMTSSHLQLSLGTVRVHTRMCPWVHTCVCACIIARVCAYVRVHGCIRVCARVCVRARVRARGCLCVHACVRRVTNNNRPEVILLNTMASAALPPRATHIISNSSSLV